MYENYAQAQRELRGFMEKIERGETYHLHNANPYIKGVLSAHLIAGGEVEVKFDGKTIYVYRREGVSGQMGGGAFLTAGTEVRTGEINKDNIISSTSAKIGTGLAGEVSYTTDGENHEWVTGVGKGLGGKVKVVDVNTGLYKEYEMYEVQILPDAGPSAEGGLTAEQWSRRLGNK